MTNVFTLAKAMLFAFVHYECGRETFLFQHAKHCLSLTRWNDLVLVSLQQNHWTAELLSVINRASFFVDFFVFRVWPYESIKITRFKLVRICSISHYCMLGENAFVVARASHRLQELTFGQSHEIRNAIQRSSSGKDVFEGQCGHGRVSTGATTIDTKPLPIYKSLFFTPKSSVANICNVCDAPVALQTLTELYRNSERMDELLVMHRTQ